MTKPSPTAGNHMPRTSPMPDETIKLTEQDLLFKGGFRYVYQHPANPDICIKILSQSALEEARRVKRRYVDENTRDSKAYAFLEKHNGSTYFKHIPRNYGMVRTSLGPGLANQLIRNPDGKPPSNLKEMLERDPSLEKDPHIIAGLHELCRFLYDERITTRQLKTFNIVPQTTERGYTMWVIDGLGNSEFIPVSDWFGAVARRKIKRRILRFAKKVPWAGLESSIP